MAVWSRGNNKLQVNATFLFAVRRLHSFGPVTYEVIKSSKVNDALHEAAMAKIGAGCGLPLQELSV